MRIDDMVVLAKAGFTKDEIIKLTQASDAKEPETTQVTKKPATKTEEPKTAGNKATEAPAIPAALEDTIARMNAAITQMQQQAIANSKQPEKLSTDDILASIINPPVNHQ